MKINYKAIIKILLICKYVSPLIAILFLFTWLIQAYNQKLFDFIDFFLHPLPNLFDSVIHTQAVIRKTIIGMGYAYSAVCFIGFFYFSNIFIKKFEKLDKLQQNNELRERLQKQKEIKQKKLQEIYQERDERRKELGLTGEQSISRKILYGLFEFQLEYIDVYGRGSSELKSLSKEFSKILSKKLREKYKNISFMINDKIFFMCKDFSMFRAITKDFLILFRIIMQLGAAQSIKTGMLFSYWAGEDIDKKEEVYKYLSKINELGYLNKIIVSSGVYFKVSKEKDKEFLTFEPLGASKLVDALGEGVDFDIDLYSITRVE